MKKILLLTAAALIFQVTPVFAESSAEDGFHGKHKGKMFAEKDANGDGVISESEFLDHAKKKFAEIDGNGDGSLSQEEMKAAHKAKREKMKEMKGKWKEKRQERKENRSDDAEEQ